MSQNSDQRYAPRIPVEVEVHVTQTSDHNFYTGLTNNVSEGGIFVATSHIFPVGATLDFEFRLEQDAQPIKTKGVVRWVRSHESLRSADVATGMGIQFLGLDASVRDRIQRFIDRRRESLFYDED